MQVIPDEQEANTQQAPAWFDRAMAAPGHRHAVDVQGCSINYLCWGEKTAPGLLPGLLIVPPSGGHAHWFSHVAPLLADQFHVVVMDPSGCGDSGRRDHYSQQLMIDEIMAVIGDSGMFDASAAPTLLGHSAGAQSAVRTALAYGQKLMGVIAVDGIRFAALEKDHAIRFFDGPRPAPRAPRVYESHEQALASFRLMPAPLLPIANRCVLDHIARHSIRRVDHGWTSKFDTAQASATTLGMELKGRLIDLQCPAAILYGEFSHLADETAAAEITGATGGRVTVFTIPGTTHYPMIDSPITFVAAVKGIALTWQAARLALAAAHKQAGPSPS